MKKIYNSKNIEKYIRLLWEKNNKSYLKYEKNKDNFCIILPPPNITGNLHMGHAFQHTIMDMLVRYNKMNGKNIFWKYGIDHAGIATQIVIEKKNKLYLKKINENNKKKLIKSAWIWKNKLNKNFIKQMKYIGNLIDYKNGRFTLDKKFCLSVKTAFIKLYENKFIYKDKKLVNWDIKTKSVISDLEIVYKNIKSYVWNIKFILLDNTNLNNNYIIISTTRPETLLGDSAIAVNPNDNRYINLIGKKVLVPIINRIIPIISDSSIDMSLWTGCVKITPAHSFEDYKIGKKHLLPIISILNKDGTIKKYAEITYFDNKKTDYELIPNIFFGLEISVARKKIVDKLIKLNLLCSVNSYNINTPFSNKSNSIIEIILTNQWFVKTKYLSINSINKVKNGEIKFIPKKYENIYFNWMSKIEDWCISRQIWWGHDIPAWYDENKNIYVGFNERDVRNKYKISDSVILKKEKDVLDTWFSSSLWTFASLGWPKYTKELNNFHPADIIVSGHDIILFWISKMIMMTLYLLNDNNILNIPFKNVYITGLIKDEIGNKMSKSHGNVIDPLDIINGISLDDLLKKRIKNLLDDNIKNNILNITKKNFNNGINQYGADALRYTFISLSYSNDGNINWNMNIVKGYRNFCNKLWNVSKFIFINVNFKNYCENLNFNDLELKVNKLILLELNITINKFRNEIENYRLDLSSKIIYDFIWNKFCSWYIEFIKIFIKQKNNSKSKEIQKVLIYILDKILKLCHPIIPFITEKIWIEMQRLLKNKNINILVLEKFPEENLSWINNEDILSNFDILKLLIINIRNIKNIILKDKNYNFIIIINTNLLVLIKIINEYKNSIIKILNIKDILINNDISIIKSDKFIKKNINSNIELIFF